jgi:hypothetical protein
MKTVAASGPFVIRSQREKWFFNLPSLVRLCRVNNETLTCPEQFVNFTDYLSAEKT